MSEAAIVLENKYGLGGQGGAGSRPIYAIGEVNVEVGDYRPAFLFQICGRGKISLLDVLQLVDQRLLRRAAGARVPLDRSLVDHNGEGEAGMSFGFCHYQFRGLVDAIVRTIPIDDDAVDSAADHIGDLFVNLTGVRGTVTDIHVIRSSEPQQKVGINFRGRARIKQRMHVYFADVASPGITVSLIDKAICRTGIVRRLRGQRGSGNDIICGRGHTSRGQEYTYCTQLLEPHFSSGAEGPRSCLGTSAMPEGGSPRL